MLTSAMVLCAALIAGLSIRAADRTPMTDAQAQILVSVKLPCC